MLGLLRVAHAIDWLNGRLGGAAAWLALAMVLVGAFNAVARYAGRFTSHSLSSNFYIELSWYLFATLFLLCGADALRRDAHVRVDVLYGRLSPRGRALVNICGSVLFLLPLCAVGFWVSFPSVRNSWAVLEGSPDPGGLPRYPIKTLILVAFALLFLQGVAELIKQVAWLRGVVPDSEHGDPMHRSEGL